MSVGENISVPVKEPGVLLLCSQGPATAPALTCKKEFKSMNEECCRVGCDVVQSDRNVPPPFIITVDECPLRRRCISTRLRGLTSQKPAIA